MTKNEIADYIVSTTTLSRSQAIEAINSTFDAIGNSLCKGESVYVRGFATFKAYMSKERNARNIVAGTAVIVPSRRSAKLVIGKELKNRMKQ